MAIDQGITHSVLGVLGNIASSLFFLSSVPTVIVIIQRKSSGGVSGDLYVFKLFNCMLWSLYGLPFVHPHDLWVVLTNAFGCAFAVFYIVPFVRYAARKERLSVLSKLFVIISCFIIMTVLVFVLNLSRHDRIMVVGILCVVVSSSMHMTLLSQANLAIKSKELKYLHPISAVAAFVKGALWTAYGIVSFDVYVVVPNGIGVVVGISQILLAVILILTRTEDTFPMEDSEDKTSRGNSMEVARRTSMDQIRKRVSIELFGRNVEEVREVEPQALVAAAVASVVGIGPLQRQSSISAVVVPIDDVKAKDVAP